MGFALLITGGRTLVTGASRLATSLGVSELAIGLTVVAFGTSAPELAVNVLAAIRGNTAIAFGNIIGSNAANIGLVLGAAALVRPLRIESVLVSREIPMMLLGTAAAVILGMDRLRGMAETYDRPDGLILLLLFVVFLYYTISEVVGQRRSDPIVEAVTQQTPAEPSWSTVPALLMAAAGLAMLLGGAQLTVANAVSLAEALEVPRVVIGLSVVALGTSMPELTTSVVAACKGSTSLAVGSVVGSNIFNLLFVLGATSTIRPVEVPEAGGGGDLAVMALLAVALLVMSRSQAAHITRGNGVTLLLAYLSYMVWRIAF
jgi:cation:H+ antiporter